MRLSIYFVGFIFMACSTQEPKKNCSLNEDTFMLLLMDIHVFDAAGRQSFIDQNGENEVKNAQTLHILNHYGINEKEFNDCLQHYAKNPTWFYDYYEILRNKLLEKQSKYENLENQQQN